MILLTGLCRNGTHFGSQSVQVNMANRDEDVLGVYASTSDGRKLTMVIVNKDVVPVNLAISNIPAGTYFLRHFGGAAGIAKWQVSDKIYGSHVARFKVLTVFVNLTDDDHGFYEQQFSPACVYRDVPAAAVMIDAREYALLSSSWIFRVLIQFGFEGA